jgi:hypothetical protein
MPAPAKSIRAFTLVFAGYGWKPVFRRKCDNAKMLERFLFLVYVKPL